MILPEIDQNSALETGNKIAEAIADALVSFSPVKVNIGIAWFKKGREDFHAMLKAADALMYQTKVDTKGGVCMRDFE